MWQQVHLGVNGALLILIFILVIGLPAVKGCERVHRSIEADDIDEKINAVQCTM
jgi:hypothetical protein